jgi:ferredoxin
MEKIISKQAVPEWIQKLENYTIYAPLPGENDGPWSFEVVQDPGKVKLDFLNTPDSPKKVVFPQREVLFAFNGPGHAHNPGDQPQGVDIKEVLPGEKPQVILGIRPCDARAMTLLDMVFEQDVPDPYYIKRRQMTTLVGLGCAAPPSPNCFCTTMGGAPHDKTGLDILVTDLGDNYYLETLSPKGVKLLDAAGALLRVPKAEERNQLKKIHADSVEKIERGLEDRDTLVSRLDKAFETSSWDEESMSCIRCGICTFLCPTCHCFDMTDEINSFAPLEGKRVRNWDTCQFPDFTMHSSGHNPRPDRASRLRRRLVHKFRYFVQTYDHFLCTGCGRCVSQCPVGIDIIELLNKVGKNE